jgi:predicted transcriptional regulator
MILCDRMVSVLSKNEEKVLRKIAEMVVITKNELKVFLNDSDSVDVIVNGLIEKKLIAQINPIGSTSFVITQKGSKFLQDLDSF